MSRILLCKLAPCGLDSVIVVELISFIEERFNIQLGDKALNTEAFKNLQSVAGIIRERPAEQQA